MHDFSATRWRKSSHSTAQANCVEVAFAGWRKSSHSTDTSNCVEVGFASRVVGVRDSKNAGGPLLAFPGQEWAVFLRTL